MKERIINLCKKIKENIRCKGCGEFIERTGFCRRCCSEDYEFKEWVDELIQCLDKTPLDEDIMLSLHSIRFLSCLEIQSILNENNYNKYVNNKFDQINNLFKNIFEFKKNDQFVVEDLKYIYYFLENNYYDDKESLLVTNRLMVLLIIKKIELSIDEKLKLVKHFTQTNMKNIYPNIGAPICVFEKRNENINRVFFEKIYLDEDKVKQFLIDYKYIDLIGYVFYECTHTLIFNQITHFKSASYLNLLNVKEMLIKENLEEYYIENKENYSHNVYSRYNCCLLLFEFLSQFGWEKNYSEVLKNRIERETKLLSNEQRILKGNNVTIDKIFDSLELNPNILNKHPILKFEYREKDERIVRKTQQELEQEYLKYLSKHGEDKETHYLFNRLIHKVKNDDLELWFDR